MQAAVVAAAVVYAYVGAEGLPVQHGEHIALADTPGDFANEIGALFENAERRRAFGQNARALVDVGAAERIPDEALTPALLRETVARFLGDRARLEAMAGAARSMARPRAAEDLAALLRSVA